MIGVQDEEHIERALQRFIRVVLRLRRLEHHVQEVRGVRQIVVGVRVRLAHHVPIAERRDGDHLRDDARDLTLPHFRIGNVLRLRIERSERRDGGDQLAHRMRVVTERVQQSLQILVDECVIRDVVHPPR